MSASQELVAGRGSQVADATILRGMQTQARLRLSREIQPSGGDRLGNSRGA